MTNLGNKEVFAKNLSRYMQRDGFTQAQLSDKLGIDQRQISRWETSRVPDVITLMQIARALDTTVSCLIGESAEA